MLKKTVLTILSFAAISVNAHADVIHFKDGREIRSPNVWEEGDQIKCERFGGVISYPKSKIASVEKEEVRQETQKTSSSPAWTHLPWDLSEYLARKVASETSIEKSVIATVAINAFIGTGSGFFISDDGYILTNRHVIEGLDKLMERAEVVFKKEEASLNQWKKILELQGKFEKHKENYDAAVKKYEKALREYNRVKDGVIIILADGSELKAAVKSVSKNTDLALLKLEGHKTPFIKPSDARLAQGNTLYAIGNPMNLSHSVTSGIFSGHRNGAIQMNIPLNPGNSGGPVINGEGRAVGISTWKMAGVGIEGISFAIPIKTALNEFRELKNR